MQLPSIDHVNLGEKVYQSIRREILQRNFKGGEKLDIYNAPHLQVQVARSMFKRDLEVCRLARSEHQEMVRSYRNRDLPALKEAIRKHLNATLTGSLRAVDERGGVL